MSNEDGCLSRSMTIKAYNKIMASSDRQYVTLHVPLTLETKDSMNEEQLMKMSKRATLINAARPEGVHEAEMLMRFSVREQTSVTSPMCQRVTTLP